MPMNWCKCGVPIKPRERRCKPCAVDMAAGFDTDSFARADAAQAESVEKETTKKFNPNQWQEIPVSKVQAEIQRRRSHRMWFTLFIIAAILFAGLAFWALYRLGF